MFMCCEWFLHIGWDISQFSCHHQSVEVFAPSQKDMLLHDTGSFLLWSWRGHGRTSNHSRAICCLVFQQPNGTNRRYSEAYLLDFTRNRFLCIARIEHWLISCHCASFLLPSLRNQTQASETYAAPAISICRCASNIFHTTVKKACLHNCTTSHCYCVIPPIFHELQNSPDHKEKEKDDTFHNETDASD